MCIIVQKKFLLVSNFCVLTMFYTSLEVKKSACNVIFIFMLAEICKFRTNQCIKVNNKKTIKEAFYAFPFQSKIWGNFLPNKSSTYFPLFYPFYTFPQFQWEDLPNYPPHTNSLTYTQMYGPRTHLAAIGGICTNLWQIHIKLIMLYWPKYDKNAPKYKQNIYWN